MIEYFYLHIPFCRQKCPYCKFALTPVFDELKKKRYIEYLKKEIREYFSGQNTCDPSLYQREIKTIYFWWGTPSILSLDEVRDILECFPERIGECEITFECNPEDITTEYIVWLLNLSINRISLGVQSLNNESLSAIHRSNESTIFAAMDSICHAITQTWKVWISVNIDFILGLPHVRKWETLENIQRLHREYPYITHTSVYILEKWIYPKSWKSHTLEDDILKQEFIDVLEYFEDIWWNHYELSNWARPGYESRHNQSYWDHSDIRGFWLSAASYVWWERYSNSDSFSGYYKWVRIWEELLTPEQIAIEELMFWLRTSGGYDIGNPCIDLNQMKIQEFISKWLIVQVGKIIKLTKTWIFLIDYIISELIS